MPTDIGFKNTNKRLNILFFCSKFSSVKQYTGMNLKTNWSLFSALKVGPCPFYVCFNGSL